MIYFLIHLWTELVRTFWSKRLPSGVFGQSRHSLPTHEHPGTAELSRSPGPLPRAPAIPWAALSSSAPAWLGVHPACMCDQNCKTCERKAQNSKINGVHLVELLQTPLICSTSTDPADEQRSASPWLSGRACSASWTGTLKEFHQNWLPPVTISPAQLIPPLSRRWRQHYSTAPFYGQMYASRGPSVLPSAQQCTHRTLLPPLLLLECWCGRTCVFEEGCVHLESSGDGGVQTSISSIDLSHFWSEPKVIFSLPALMRPIEYFRGKHWIKREVITESLLLKNIPPICRNCH